MRRAWKMAFFFGVRPDDVTGAVVVSADAGVFLLAGTFFVAADLAGADDVAELAALATAAFLPVVALLADGFGEPSAVFGVAARAVALGAGAVLGASARPCRPKAEVSDRFIFLSAWTMAVGTSSPVALVLSGWAPAGRTSTRHRLSAGPDLRLLTSLR